MSDDAQRKNAGMAYTGVECLFKLWQEAMGMYTTAVVENGFDYKSFSQDFINSRMHVDSADARSRNDHQVNLGRIQNLLRYEQVVRHYSLSPLSWDNFIECMRTILLRNHPEPSQSPSDFQCHFSPQTISAITAAANAIPLFTSMVTDSDMELLFNKCMPVANPHLKSKVNQHLAYFFSQLDSYGLICRNYQQIIEKNNLIYSSASDSPLSAHNIAQSLDRINCSTNPIKNKIETLVKMIKQASLTPVQTENS